MGNKKMHVVQVGSSGFPIGMAAIEKMRLLGIGLIDAGVDVTVLCREGTFYPDEKVELEPEGVVQGIKYIYTSGSVYRPESFLVRNLKKLQGWINEIRLLFKYRRENHLDAAIVHSMDFTSILIYRILATLFQFKFLYLYVEMNSSLPERKDVLRHRIEDYLLENLGLKMPDGIFPISNVLVDFVHKKAKQVPVMKIPVICEFSKFEVPKSGAEHKYFLYCGSATYSEVIYFILDAFDQLTDQDYYLYMVIGGNPKDIETVKARIGQSKNKDRVRTFSRIPYEELVQKYIDAKALLIPLRFTIQDEARFPHKVGEYLASGNPMITTNVGEIKSYFVNGETAIIADAYEINEFAEKMQFVIDHPQEAEAIGKRGKELGLNTFDYPVFGRDIKSFVLELES